MPRFKLPPFRSLFCCSLLRLLIILQSSEISAAGYEFISSYCPTDANYTTNSTYQSNLNSLLSSLSSSAASATGYYNNTAGQRPNQVYGLVQCRGDESPDDCRSCIKTATQNIVQRCPRGQNSAVFYDECFLRYSNQSFFSPKTTQEKYIAMCNPQNSSNPKLLDNFLGSLMNDLTTQASKSPRKYADGVVTTSAAKLYGLMQCTRDLSQATCSGCLKDIRSNIPKICGQRNGGRIVGFNCYVRYESYQFYNTSADHNEITPAPMLLPSAPAPAPMLLPSSPALTPTLVPPTTNVVAGAPLGSNLTREKSNSHRTWVLPHFLIMIIEVAVFLFI